MLRLKAYAKINLSLKILGKRPDNFHELESIMQSVSLADVITLEQLPAGIQLTTNNQQLTTDNRNLAYKAAEIYFKGQGARGKGQGVKVHIEKNIPIAAGLAGGSADAAAVLYGLNQMTNDQCQMSNEGLINLGAQIGSDVPFCLTGGRCLARGRGEKLERLSTHQPNHPSAYIIVMPEVEVSTKWAYEEYDKSQSQFWKPANELRGFQNMNIQGNRDVPTSTSSSRDPDSYIGIQSQVSASNDLEAVVINKYPVIQEVKDRLLKLGCERTQMSGSGPSVFGTVKNADEGEAVLAEIKKHFSRCFLVHSVERGIEEF